MKCDKVKGGSAPFNDGLLPQSGPVFAEPADRERPAGRETQCV